MTPAQYVEQCLVTESKGNYPSVILRLGAQGGIFSNPEFKELRILHAAMGCVTESAELMDAMKKFLMYGKPLDETNVIEEMGDLLWYVAILASAMNVTFEEVMDKNIAKLRTRYGDKFTSERAINRNLDAEVKALEGDIPLDPNKFTPGY